MFTAEYKDMTELSRGLTERLVYASKDELDVLNAMDFQLNNVMVRSETCEYDYDLKQTWVTASRWTSLVRQYLDPIALEGFLGQVGDKLRGKKRGIAFLRTQMVAKRSTVTNNKEWRRWGSCMLGFSYTALPRPTITLHSRTTYLGYIGQLDLALAHVLAREIGNRVGLTPADIAFVWVIDGAQFHSFKSLAWFFQNERDAKRLTREYSEADLKKLRKRYPVLARARHRFDEFVAMDDEGLKYCDMSFAQQLRIRRRYHTEVFGEEYGLPWEGGTRLKAAGMAKVAPALPSIPVERLDFSPLRKVTVLESQEPESMAKAGIIDQELDETEDLDDLPDELFSLEDAEDEDDE